MTTIAINGFGRIGRLFFKAALQEKSFSVKAINDLGDIENLAYLLRYDTAYGRFDEEVSVKNGELIVGKTRVPFLQEKDPTQLPWKKLGIDVVIESTGAFESFEKAAVHLTAGAKRVVLTAPAKDADTATARTVLSGINDMSLKGATITSNGSCTTNAAAPVIQVLSNDPGIEKAILSTVHGYTTTQSLVDGPVRGTDYRRGRAAGQNITPSSTGAARTVAKVIPELAGKFDGISLRVPVVTGSIVDITFIAKRRTTKEEVNTILRNAAARSEWKGILSVSDEQLVSSDIIGEPFGAIVDLASTTVVDGTLVKVLAWYDNEAGYVSTLIRHVKAVAGLL
jgi:glyceraldehyde 3-phosphate dehydrogenase